MTMPDPIPWDVFADRELTTETHWYDRVFSKFNALFAANSQITDSGWITDTTGFSVVATGGGTINNVCYRTVGDICDLYIRFTCNSALGTTNAAGAVTGSPSVIQLPTALIPTSKGFWPFQTGPSNIFCQFLCTTGGIIHITTSAPLSTSVGAGVYTISGTLLLNGANA